MGVENSPFKATVKRASALSVLTKVTRQAEARFTSSIFYANFQRRFQCSDQRRASAARFIRVRLQALCYAFLILHKRLRFA